MGGDVNAPIATKLEVGEPFDLGGGFEGYLVVSPAGKTHVVESETGAFVGTSIDDVKADIAAGDPAIIRLSTSRVLDQRRNGPKIADTSTRRLGLYL